MKILRCFNICGGMLNVRSSSLQMRIVHFTKRSGRLNVRSSCLQMRGVHFIRNNEVQEKVRRQMVAEERRRERRKERNRTGLIIYWSPHPCFFFLKWWDLFGCGYQYSVMNQSGSPGIGCVWATAGPIRGTMTWIVRVVWQGWHPRAAQGGAEQEASQA
jgi:hypothetical protein